MKRIVAGMCGIIASLLVLGCDITDEEQNFHFVTLNVVDADFPEVFELNANYDITVTYERPNGCTFFQGFDVQSTALTSRDVVAIGSDMTDSETGCTQAIEEVEANFAFRVLYDETYNFRFFAGNDSEGNPTFLEYTIEVNSGSPDQP